MMLVETYWQPQFTGLLRNDALLWLLGVLGFGYFLASIFGSLAAEKMTKRYHVHQIFLLGNLLAGLCALALGAVTAPALFGVLYLLLYFLLGAADTAQDVIIHRATPSAVRATVLSAQGLTLQLGALAASGAAGLVAGRFSVSVLWQAGALLFLVGFAGIAYILRKATH